MVAWMIDRFGSDEQRQRFLPKLCTMEHLASYCLTEPGAGSDAAALKTQRRARRRSLRPQRRRSSSSPAPASPISTSSMVRTGEARRLAASRPSSSRRTRPASPSARTRRRWAGTRSRRAQVIFEDARVPVANRLGEEGIGFKIAMAGLDGGRLNIGACSLGGAQAALDKSLAYAKERKAFGAAHRRFPGAAIQARRHGDRARSARSFLWRAAAALDAKAPDATQALRDGQALRHRHRLRGRQRGAADPRRLRLPGRLRHREDRPRPARPPDPRRHQRDHAPDRRRARWSGRGN